MVCEWNHEEGRLVKHTAPEFHCDADWAALSNAGYIIYDEAAHTWYATAQGRALNNLIKEAFAELAARAEQEAKEKQEETRGTIRYVSGAPEDSVEDQAPSEKSENMKIKTFTFLISCFAGTADFGPAGCWGQNFTGDNLTPSDEIDKFINEFIANKDVVSISVQYPVVSGHNNGGYNTVMAVYTIIYND